MLFFVKFSFDTDMYKCDNYHIMIYVIEEMIKFLDSSIEKF